MNIETMNTVLSWVLALASFAFGLSLGRIIG